VTPDVADHTNGVSVDAEVAKKATLRRYTIYPTASVDAGAAKARPDKHSSLVAFLPLAGVAAFARYNAAK
jgi:hypothetical protein